MQSATFFDSGALAVCGVTSTRGWCQNGWPAGSGSTAKTSSEAPARWPLSSAAAGSPRARSAA